MLCIYVCRNRHPRMPPLRRGARGALGLMFDPVFGALFWGKMFAVVAVWTHGIVAAIVMYDATRSALMVGLVGVAAVRPATDPEPRPAANGPTPETRHDRFCSAGCCASLGPVSWRRGSSSTPVYRACPPRFPSLLGSLLVGFGFVVGGPAMQSIVPNLIRQGELSTAMALNSMPMTVGRILGPASGAYLAAHLGSAAGIRRQRRPAPRVRGLRHRGAIPIATAASHRCRLPRPHRRQVRLAGPPPVPGTDRGGNGRYRIGSVDHADPVDGRRTRRRHPTRWDFVGGVRHRRSGRDGGARVDAAAGWPRCGCRRSGCSAWPPACGVLAFGTVPAVAIAGFTLAGLGFGWAMTGLATVVQERAPEELRGRIMALWLVGFVGSRPIAAALLGGTADLVSVQAAFAVAAALSVVVALLCRPGNLMGPLPHR